MPAEIAFCQPAAFGTKESTCKGKYVIALAG